MFPFVLKKKTKKFVKFCMHYYLSKITFTLILRNVGNGKQFLPTAKKNYLETVFIPPISPSNPSANYLRSNLSSSYENANDHLISVEFLGTFSWYFKDDFNPLSTRLLPTNCLSMFDHFIGLALKGLRII